MTQITRTEHEPRLLLTREQWENLPGKLSDPYFAAIDRTNGQGLERVAAHLAAIEPETDASGKRRPLGDFRYVKQMLERAAVGWYLHREQRCLDAAERVVQMLLDRSNWTCFHSTDTLKHYGLKMGELTYCAAFALDVLGGYLAAESRDGLVAVIREVALPEYLAGLEAGEWWRYAEFNWGTATHGNAGFAALVIEAHDPELAEQVLRQAKRGVEFVIEAIPADGGWTEGMMYTTTMLGHLTDFVAALHRCRGEDLGLIDNPRLHALMDYRPYMIGGDGYLINFSNVRLDTPEYCFPGGYWWARQCGRPQWAWFENQHVKPWDSTGLWHDVQAFWYREADQPAEPIDLDRLRHFRELDWVKWTGETSWLGFRSGFNGGNHNNRDLGHFVFGIERDRFAVDPGYGAGATNQHNAVTLASPSQTVDARARVFRLRELAGGLYLCCDLTEANPHRAAYHHRHLLLVDEAHLLVIDDVLGRAGRRPGVGWHLQTHLPVDLDGRRATLRGEQRALHVTPLTEQTTEPSVHEWTWHERPVRTLTWKPKPDLAHTRMAMLLSVEAAAPALTFDGDIASVEIGGRRWAIDLSYGVLREPIEA